MKQGGKFIGIFMALFLVLGGCIDSYNPPESSGSESFLVVDGFLNGTDGICTVTLSRTMPLNASEILYEEDATVTLVDNTGNQYLLDETSAGHYTVSGLTLDNSKQYKIIIETDAGLLYESEEQPLLTAPPIDSLTWKNDRTGVAVSINSHDPANNTRYYYWNFQETWAYTAAFNSILVERDDTVVMRSASEAIFLCYQNAASSSILVGSSNKLADDIIRNFNLTTVPYTSPKTSVRYSILVEQRAITQEAYEYWQQLKKNTEELGTIFDPLPSITLGNIHAIGRPDEMVVGYFNASNVQRKRLYISRNEIDFPGLVRPITGFEGCTLSVKLFEEPLNGMTPIGWYNEMVGGMSIPKGYTVALPSCADCRSKGGTLIQPDFWE